MLLFRLGLRWGALLALAVWFGGFTFYAAVVVPVLEDVMGRFEAGANVTREVTRTLNAIGVATLAVWWVLVVVEGPLGDIWSRRGRVALLALNSAILAGLFAAHRVLDSRIETDQMAGFYRLHESYLIASTVQWGANIALVGLSLWIWYGSAARPER